MFSFFSPVRTVFLMGDEALHVYSVQGSSARLVESVPWSTDGFASYVARIAAEDCHGHPILLLYDMTEQSYKRDTILNVSTLDRAAMLQRKLKVAFPTHPVRGAMLLKEKPSGPVAAGPGQALYILAAIPESEALDNAIEAARRSGAQILGLTLLPAESAGLVAALVDRVTTEKQGRSGWAVLITQHVGGDLRQIVIKGGDLALTRMTPITIDPTTDPQDWADEGKREFRATVDYISRFGYGDEDPLQVIVVAPLAAGALLEEAIQVSCTYTCLPAADALQVMDWSVPASLAPMRGTGDGVEADLLHVLWAGKKRFPAMRMQAPVLESFARPRLYALVASLLLILLAAGQVVQAGMAYGSLATTRGEIEDVQTQKAQLDIQHQAQIKRQESFEFDVALLQSSVAVYRDLESDRLDLLPVAQAISEALGQNMRLASVEVTRLGQKFAPAPQTWGRRPPRSAQEDKSASSYEMTLHMTFPAETDPDRGNQEVEDLRDRMQAALPEHEVTVTKFLKDYGFDKEVVVQSRTERGGGRAQDFLVIIKIVAGGSAP